MKRIIPGLLSLLTLAELSFGQLATDPNAGLWVTKDNPSAFTLRWYGATGKTYFLQTSFDLLSWFYLGDIEPGQNLVIPYGFTSSSGRFFLRLRYSTIPTNDPENADFDGDRIGNRDELNQGTDPLSRAADADGDGLPDDWEKFYFGDLSHNPGDIDDGGTLTNAEQFDLRLNPTVNEASTLTYDATGRLTGGGAGQASFTYSYDSAGNITNAQ